jgi:choline dehydrogenase-like flavoprotein
MLPLASEAVRHAPVRRLATDAAVVLPDEPEARRRAVIDGAYSIPHTVGTCRMGPSPDDGDVVDPMGRVHGVEGLSVIDASIIPETTAGLPHLVTMMSSDLLAERTLRGRSSAPGPPGEALTGAEGAA